MRKTFGEMQMIESGYAVIARRGPNVPRFTARRQGRRRQKEPKNGMLVLKEREANKRLSENISPVVRRRDLFKLHSPVKLSATYHGVARCFPFVWLLEKHAR